MADKKTVCLNMIVRNESRVIERCLESVKPFIDYWIIVDTGSIDGTQKIIEKCMKNIPGELYEYPWKDFEHNRNHALKLANKKADYLLFIDADETFIYPQNFQLPNLDKDYYFFNIQYETKGKIVSNSKRILLVNNQLCWQWKGVLHEDILCSQAKSFAHVSGIDVISRTQEGYRYQNPNKYMDDAKILKKALKDDPDNARYVYYIAQSYLNASQKQKALEYFKKRVLMKPNQNNSEVYLSLYFIGILQEALGVDFDTIVQSFSSAYLYRTTRAEPLYRLGNLFLKKDNFLVADLFFRKALSIPLPLETSFTENWIYSWGILLKFSECAFKMGNFSESKSAIEKLLKHQDVPLFDKQYLQKNLDTIIRITAQKFEFDKDLP